MMNWVNVSKLENILEKRKTRKTIYGQYKIIIIIINNFFFNQANVWQKYDFFVSEFLLKCQTC